MTPLEEKIEDEVRKLLQGHYSCSRVWEAWQYGTMKQDDFSPLEEEDDVVNDFTAMIQSIATQAVEEYKKELLEKLPEHVENGDSPRSSNPIDEYIWHEQNGKNSMLSRVKSLINKSN